LRAGRPARESAVRPVPVETPGEDSRAATALVLGAELGGLSAAAGEAVTGAGGAAGAAPEGPGAAGGAADAPGSAEGVEAVSALVASPLPAGPQHDRRSSIACAVWLRG
jgi:hypothetical protein